MDEERMEKTEVVPGSTGAYIGFEILFAIPGVGLICAIIFGFFSKNENMRHYARAHIAIWAIMIGFFIMALIGGSGR